MTVLYTSIINEQNLFSKTLCSYFMTKQHWEISGKTYRSCLSEAACPYNEQGWFAITAKTTYFTPGKTVCCETVRFIILLCNDIYKKTLNYIRMLGVLHYMCDVSSILWVLLGTRTVTVRLPPPRAPVDVLIYILISSQHQKMLCEERPCKN